MKREDVPTPSLVLELAALERNIAVMAAHAREAGVALRPHAKSHKCVEIARLLAKAGALGPACATIGEVEAMAAGGVGGILATSPLVSWDALDRLRRLFARGAELMLTVDDPRNADALAELARPTGRPLPLIVELDVGVGRTGCPEIADAVALARHIAGRPELTFAGVQAYWGNLQQVMPLDERQRRVAVQTARLESLIAALREAGLPPAIVTGGGTGTSWIDPRAGLFTEIQPGSFLFLDSCYGAIPLSAEGNPFAPSLFVATTVVNAANPRRAIVNAGFKGFATDSGKPEPCRGAPPGGTYCFMGDEHGAIDFPADHGLAPGAAIELLTSHCDPTVNLYSRFLVVDGEDRVTDEWPIAARGY